MGATTCLQWSQPILPHSPSSQTVASTVLSPSPKRRTRGEFGPLVCRIGHRLDRSSFFGFGAPSMRLYRSRSCDYPFSTLRKTRACSASSISFSDEEFSKKIQELAPRFQLSDKNEDTQINFADSEPEDDPISTSFTSESQKNPLADPPDWPDRDEIILASIERKANSVDLPLSLRMIKKKMQWKESFREASESAYCSVKKAFSSMVFIIRELHSYTLQMRELLFYEDLQGILNRVQKEIHVSFVWLFQQVFSHTPTLMVYLMILLANFTVFSIGHNAAIAASSHPPTGSYESIQTHSQKNQKFDSLSIKTFSVSGKTTSVGGNHGGGGKTRPVASGTDGNEWFNRSNQLRTIPPDGASQLSSTGTNETESSITEQENREEEVRLWNSLVHEAWKMGSVNGSEGLLSHETMKRFVSPVSAKIEADDGYTEYLRTDLVYRTGLSQEPNNPLLLANYAQFLYLVAHDYDRAEEYFKRAVGAEPPDAEAFNKYATFLWRVRKDFWAAEETYLEAISADPTNSFYAANYAHFLWNTGGEDTCFPLPSPETSHEEA